MARSISAYEAELELDLGRAGIDDFMRWLNGTSRILDISIADPPIEEAIKAIYGK